MYQGLSFSWEMEATGEMATTEGEAEMIMMTAKTMAEIARGGDSMDHTKAFQ